MSLKQQTGTPFAIVVMGVAGSGKSTIGGDLARKLTADFLEGDDFHPPSNVALMAAGTPLTDENRKAWLDLLGAEMNANLAAGRSTVVSCSALKRQYRDTLRRYAPDAIFVFLEVDRHTALTRVAGRRSHFMPPSLVESQFETLEPPGSGEKCIGVDGGLSPDAIIEEIVRQLTI